MWNLRKLWLIALLGQVALVGPVLAEAPQTSQSPPSSPSGPGPEVRAHMTVCTDGQSNYVALGPDRQSISRLYYGDGKRFIAVEPDHDSRLTGNDFYDPRFFSPTWNANFRGIDMRFYSGVQISQQKKTCSVRCGQRSAEMKLLDPREAQELMRAATFDKGPLRFDPHRLARDEEGNYYYIDRGTRENSQQFRLYFGPRGNMKQLKLTNTVSDSEGDIFSTKTGSLRLVVGRAQGQWIEKGRRKPLVVVPIEDPHKDWQNLLMIYQDLGVYTGELQGTPCDMPLRLQDPPASK